MLFSISKVGDRTGELTAEMNIADLKVVLGISDVNTKYVLHRSFLISLAKESIEKKTLEHVT